MLLAVQIVNGGSVFKMLGCTRDTLIKRMQCMLGLLSPTFRYVLAQVTSDIVYIETYPNLMDDDDKEENNNSAPV